MQEARGARGVHAAKPGREEARTSRQTREPALPATGRAKRPNGAAAQKAPSTAKLVDPAHDGVALEDGPTREEIAREAYLIWLETGGNEVVNWLEAERRLRASYAAKVAGDLVSRERSPRPR